MIIYILLFTSIILIGLSKLAIKDTLIFIILFLFSALRFDVGYDYSTYYNVINYQDEGNYFRFGSIDKLLIDIARDISFYQFYFIITSFFTLYLISTTVKKYSDNYFLSILIFITIPIFYLMSFSIIRQFLAIAIVFYAIRFIINRNLFKFIIFVLIASLFHYSALISLPMYFLYRVKFTKIFSLIIIFLSIFISPFLSKILILYFPYYSNYFNNASHGKSLLYFLFFILIFIFMHYKYIKDYRTSFYFNVYTIGISLYIMFIQLGDVGIRISYYYLIFLIFLIPSILKIYKVKQAYFIMIILTLFIYIFNFYLFEKNNYKNAYIPYNIFLNVDEETYNWR